jgi:hypothetical protein
VAPQADVRNGAWNWHGASDDAATVVPLVTRSAKGSHATSSKAAPAAAAAGGGLAGVEGRLEPGVADRVHGDVEAAADRGLAGLAETGEQHPDLDVVAPDVRVDGGEDPAVGEQLDRAGPQAFVALARRRPVEPGAVEVVEDRQRVWQREHRHGQRVVAAHRRVQRLGLGRARGVVHGRDPVGEQRPAVGGDVLCPAVGLEVGRHGPGVCLRPCPLDEPPGEPAVGPALVLAADGVGCVRSDAERVEPAAADGAFVDAVVGDDDGAVEARRVEHVAIDGEARDRRVEAVPANPLRLWLPGGLLAQCGHELVGAADRREVGPARMERGDADVVVGVDEPRRQGPAREIDDGRVGVRGREVGRPDRGDPALLDDDDLGARVAGVHREDRPAPEDDRHVSTRLRNPSRPSFMSTAVAPTSAA